MKMVAFDKTSEDNLFNSMAACHRWRKGTGSFGRNLNYYSLDITLI